jgi:hypothetical protein
MRWHGHGDYFNPEPLIVMREPFVEAASIYPSGDVGGHRRRVVTIDESQNGMGIVGPVPLGYRGRAIRNTTPVRLDR